MSLDLVKRREDLVQANINQPMATVNTDLKSEYSQLWGELRKIEQIYLSEIRPYQSPGGKPQPYRIQKNKVERIAISVKDLGVLQPIVVRPIKDIEFKYEVLAGHHRYLAAIENEHSTIPVEIYNVDDSKAYQIVAESNTRTEKVLPSENAEIYNAYMEMRPSSEQQKTALEIATKFDVSVKSIYRYISTLSLNKNLQKAVDTEIIPIKSVEKIVSQLTHNQQMDLWQYIDTYQPKKITAKQIDVLCSKASEYSEFSTDEINEWFHPPKTVNNQKNIYDRIKKDYPKIYRDVSSEDIDNLLINLLEKYMKNKNE